MASTGPVFDQVNLVVEDMEAALAFYRRARAVDAMHARLTAAGHASRQAPYDTFWGSRYAIVEDPDRNQVGLMSPPDRARGFVPTPRE